ncbi:MAG: hypothetical protein GJ680_11445 [Alteromonadaceae bacterium]|nr:hypothetical protein [Alteromonadaceae bacterium]
MNRMMIRDQHQYSAKLKEYDGIYILKLNLNGAGFGAMLLQTLNQIRYCERNKLLPVVNYDVSCESYYFDENKGENMWAQYFAPVVTPFDFNLVSQMCNDPSYPLDFNDLQNLDDEQMLRICEHHQDSIYSFTFADWRTNRPKDIANWYAQQRAKGHDVFSRYIRVNSEVQNKVDDFYRLSFQGYQVLGIHIRGTDLMYAPPVSPAEYFPHVEKWLSAQTKPKIFIATDQAQYLDVFQQRYGDIVIAYDSSRSTNEIAPFNLKEIPPHKKGEDVLIDMLLLSKVDFLLKGASAVGELVLYINPTLASHDLSVDKRFAFGQDYGEGWNGGLQSQTKPAWQLIKKQNLQQLNVDSNTQNQIQAFLYKYRPIYSPTTLFFKRVIRYFYKLVRFK